MDSFIGWCSQSGWIESYRFGCRFVETVNRWPRPLGRMPGQQPVRASYVRQSIFSPTAPTAISPIKANCQTPIVSSKAYAPITTTPIKLTPVHIGKAIAIGIVLVVWDNVITAPAANRGKEGKEGKEESNANEGR